MELANVSLSIFKRKFEQVFWPQLFHNQYTLLYFFTYTLWKTSLWHQWSSKLSQTLGENNKVNFTLTTFSVVEVGTLFVSMNRLSYVLFFFVLPSWQLKWFSDFKELQLKLWRDTAHSLHALPSIPPTTVKGCVTSLSDCHISSWCSLLWPSRTLYQSCHSPVCLITFLCYFWGSSIVHCPYTWEFSPFPVDIAIQ